MAGLVFIGRASMSCMLAFSEESLEALSYANPAHQAVVAIDQSQHS